MIVWIKKHWKTILCVVLIVPALLWVVRWLVMLIANSDVPNFTDLDRKLKTDMEDIDGKERAALEEIDQERKRLKRGIDAGDPSAAEVFNQELEGKNE